MEKACQVKAQEICMQLTADYEATIASVSPSFITFVCVGGGGEGVEGVLSFVLTSEPVRGESLPGQGPRDLHAAHCRL